eukprot:1673-Heterococcus_DN1.PRE.2
METNSALLAGYSSHSSAVAVVLVTVCCLVVHAMHRYASKLCIADSCEPLCARLHCIQQVQHGV